MANDEMGERSEMPTARQRSEARGRGQVPKSQDLTGAVGLAAGTVLLVVFGGSLLSTMAAIMTRVFEGQTPGSVLDPASVGSMMKWAAMQAGKAMLPVFVLIFLIAYVTQYLQVGWLLTLKPIQPKLSKISPIAGFKRVFSKRNSVKSVVNSGKLVVVIGVSTLVIGGAMPDLLALPRLEARIAMLMVGRLSLELAVWLLLVLLMLAVIDLIYQRWQHTEDLKMTKQQVKDERRSMEGDPLVKQRRSRIAMEIAMQRVQQAVPDADVVITNPTHFAVAMKYDSETMNAPRVVAKGADLMALRIRQIASANAVPIVERAPLARALFWGVEVGREVPAEHFEAIAEILAYVYRTEATAAA